MQISLLRKTIASTFTGCDGDPGWCSQCTFWFRFCRCMSCSRNHRRYLRGWLGNPVSEDSAGLLGGHWKTWWLSAAVVGTPVQSHPWPLRHPARREEAVNQPIILSGKSKLWLTSWNNTIPVFHESLQNPTLNVALEIFIFALWSTIRLVLWHTNMLITTRPVKVILLMSGLRVRS